MNAHTYDKPWQVLPAKIIQLALEYAEQNDDFNSQIAYLLLDVGVEAALKTFLVNREHSIERLPFFELLKRTKDELYKSRSSLAKQIDEVGYFHGIRNKLYHEGDGVKPTEENLKRYAALAKRIIEEVIEVELTPEEKKFTVIMEEAPYKFEELVDIINNRFGYFLENCGIVTEKIKPAYGTREFSMKLKHIRDNWRDEEEMDPEARIELRQLRLEKFNELTGVNNQDLAFVDFLLENSNHLLVLNALIATNENLRSNWEEYKELNDKQHGLLNKWTSEVQSKKMTVEQVQEEFKKIVDWLNNQEKVLGEWIDSHMEDIDRPERSMDALDFGDLRNFIKTING